jgi:hypothetical protein
MSQKNSNNSEPVSAGKTESNTTYQVFTKVPGVDMSLVIASPPHMVKENSAHVETTVEYREPHDRPR